MTRGFAKMTPEKQRELASRGGSSVPADKRSFSQDTSLASRAGAKGGGNVPPERRSFSTNNDLAREAGRKGGLHRNRKWKEKGSRDA